MFFDRNGHEPSITQIAEKSNAWNQELTAILRQDLDVLARTESAETFAFIRDRVILQQDAAGFTALLFGRERLHFASIEEMALALQDKYIRLSDLFSDLLIDGNKSAITGRMHAGILHFSPQGDPHHQTFWDGQKQGAKHRGAGETQATRIADTQNFQSTQSRERFIKGFLMTTTKTIIEPGSSYGNVILHQGGVNTVMRPKGPVEFCDALESMGLGRDAIYVRPPPPFGGDVWRLLPRTPGGKTPTRLFVDQGTIYTEKNVPMQAPGRSAVAF